MRIGCGAVCAALASTLGCGCALLPPATGVPGAASSAVSVPTDDSGKPLYDPAVLNDDRLRVLYCYAIRAVALHHPVRQQARCTSPARSENVLAGGGHRDHRHRRLLAAQLGRPAPARCGRRTGLFDKDRQ
ncbi:MAG: hypothetical protein ACLVJH_01185 [Faecalibacterium prausnitzii]